MPLKFAFLGAWHSHAVMHVREAAARPAEFELLGMFDPDPAVIARNRERWAGHGLEIPVYASAQALLDSPAEAVAIEGHIHQNLAAAEAALGAGKHVLLEKPAGDDLARFEAVQALAADRGLHLQLAYMWRYNPAIRQILRLAAGGALGQVFQFRGHIPKPKDWHPQLAREFTGYPGGVYFEMAGHLVDLMVALMGEPLRVHPALGRHWGDRTQVDNAVVVHECADGIGIVDTTAMQVGMDRRLEVHGTGGTALHEPLGSDGLRLFLEGPVDGCPAGEWVSVARPSGGAFPAGAAAGGVEPSLLRELAACIRGDKEPDYRPEHDLAVQRTLLRGAGMAPSRT